MKKFLSIGLAAVSLGIIAMTTAPVRAADYPNVKSLRPFSAECNYMSRAGYLRYLVYQQNGVWLSRSEAVAIVNSQGTAAGE